MFEKKPSPSWCVLILGILFSVPSLIHHCILNFIYLYKSYCNTQQEVQVTWTNQWQSIWVSQFRHSFLNQSLWSSQRPRWPLWPGSPSSFFFFFYFYLFFVFVFCNWKYSELVRLYVDLWLEICFIQIQSLTLGGQWDCFSIFCIRVYDVFNEV